jgi:hypothetical protein
LRKSPTEIRVVVDQRYCPKKRKETVQAGRALPVGLKVTFLRIRQGRDATTSSDLANNSSPEIRRYRGAVLIEMC